MTNVGLKDLCQVYVGRYSLSRIICNINVSDVQKAHFNVNWAYVWIFVEHPCLL